MTWVRRQADEHTCNKPSLTRGQRDEKIRAGDIWECDDSICKKQFRVHDGGYGGGLFFEPVTYHNPKPDVVVHAVMRGTEFRALYQTGVSAMKRATELNERFTRGNRHRVVLITIKPDGWTPED